MIVDTHAHLTFEGLVENLPEVLSRAREAGVAEMIAVGTNPADSAESVKIAEQNKGVWAAVGVHPNDLGQIAEKDLDDLCDLARSPKVKGWGEIGLDYYWDRIDRKIQKKWFREQIARARELELPVIVHARDANADALEVLKEQADDRLRGVFHCFSGDEAVAREVLNFGFYISFPGTITYPKNEDLRRVAASVPLERILLETDCPFLAPQPKRGKKNEPSYVIHTAKKLAEIRGLELQDIARATTRACRNLFGIGFVESAKIAYPIRRSLYLNLTNRCTNKCIFCSKDSDPHVKGHDLGIEKEPSRDEILTAVQAEGGPGAWDEIVFCGYGEPLLRLDDVVSLAGELRKRGAKRIRINTNGHANAVYGRDVAKELEGLIDSVSVSLNAHDADEYDRLCRPHASGAHAAVVDFIRAASGRIPEVSATVVDAPGVDVEACRELATNLGVKFRVRKYNEVG